MGEKKDLRREECMHVGISAAQLGFDGFREVPAAHAGTERHHGTLPRERRNL